MSYSKLKHASAIPQKQSLQEHASYMCTTEGLYKYILKLLFRPLSEGKVLKTKFDDIFAATRY